MSDVCSCSCALNVNTAPSCPLIFIWRRYCLFFISLSLCWWIKMFTAFSARLEMQDVAVDAVEGNAEIEQAQQRNFLTIIGGVDVRQVAHERRLCWVVASLGRLETRQQVVCLSLPHDLVGDDSFDDFGDEGQVWDRSIILHLAVVERRCLQQWRHDGMLLWRR